MAHERADEDRERLEAEIEEVLAEQGSGDALVEKAKRLSEDAAAVATNVGTVSKVLAPLAKALAGIVGLPD